MNGFKTFIRHLENLQVRLLFIRNKKYIYNTEKFEKITDNEDEEIRRKTDKKSIYCSFFSGWF